MNSIKKNHFLNYAEYLRKRSIISYYYRKYYLYPKISKPLKGLVLDVGCGIGDYLEFRKNTIGVDINPFLVDICKNKNLKSKLMRNDVLPFETSYFEGVIFDNVLEHIKNPKKIILEIRRVLKKNHYLIVGVPGSLGYTMDNDHKVYYDKLELKNLFENFGFTFKESYGMPINFNFFEKIMRQYCLYARFERI